MHPGTVLRGVHRPNGTDRYAMGDRPPELWRIWKLDAILVANVVGHSRLAGADESHACRQPDVGAMRDGEALDVVAPSSAEHCDKVVDADRGNAEHARIGLAELHNHEKGAGYGGRA